MAALHFKGTVVEQNGKRRLKVDAPSTYEKILDSFKLDQRVILSIDKLSHKRSNTQNNYYWVYLEVIEKETGNLATDLHEYFKRALLPPKFITVFKKEIRIPRSTTDLSKAEFSDYITKIHALTDVPPPDPELAGYISNDKPYH